MNLLKAPETASSKLTSGFISMCVILLSFNGKAQTGSWPVLKHYENAYINNIAMPVGGIGTGTISIGGNGQWKDVEIMNKPGKGFYGSVSPKQAPCFLVYTEDESGRKRSKALLGPVSVQNYPGSEGSAAPNHGLPRFASASFDTAYPFAIVNLEDDEMPVSAKLRVFNPFVPGDPDASGIPVAIIRYEIKNTTNKPVKVAVAGTLDNFIGMDGSAFEISDWNQAQIPIGANNNRNTFRQTENLAGIYMTSDSVDQKANTWGTIALTTSKNERDEISYRTELSTKGWNSNLTDMWDDFSDDGIFKDTTFTQKRDDPRACLSVKTALVPNETREFEFMLTWHFPNRRDWFNRSAEILGNYYALSYQDAWDVAEKTLPRISLLEDKTRKFVTTLLESDYPDVVKEAALFNTSTLRTQTTFRLKDGNFFGWEGIFSKQGSCYGNCTHVWNYEQATPFLFGALATKMREVEYNHGLEDSTGLMSFRVSLPFDKASNWRLAAADGQMGTIMKLYREWQLSGDDDFLKTFYPKVKKALAFAWIPGGWDADKDGVMEGCQHNTMDIEYYGPNPEIEFWYLGALKAASKMAAYLDDKAFEKTCTTLFEKGSKWTDANLFNGEYYIQIVQPITDRSKIAEGLTSGMGSKDLENPDFQVGEGCLIDQLVGQYMAHICGLGYLANPDNIRKALESIARYNYVASFGDHFSNLRSFALGDEAGLSLTAYPNPDNRPEVPLSYHAEAWSGMEYTAAAGMIYEGMEDEALKTIANVRSRYDGLKRNPYNEEECGNHYARAMASWASIIALSKFNYSAVEGKFTITEKPGNYFWSNGYSWGNAVVSKAADGKVVVDINVHHGDLKVSSVALSNKCSVKLKKAATVKPGGTQKVQLSCK